MGAGRAARTVARVSLTALMCFALASLFAVELRYAAALSGLASVPQAEAAEGPGQDRSSQTVRSYAVEVEYCSEAVAASGTGNSSGRTSTTLAFDDAWLLAGDPTQYNHGLATACAVIAAVCNSESQFYGGIEGAEPYAEQALAQIGFTDVRTDSYRLRSSVLDQVGALVYGSHDVVAYTFASKRVDGETIVLVGIRGSYGCEWVSNFKLFGEDGHAGFEAAEAEVADMLARYLDELGADPAHTRILITGHSRGGAVANLLAADLDERAGGEGALVSAKGIFAYTFAAPNTTRESDRSQARYGNVFNVANPADIVPDLPLSQWGYGRYGVTVELPRADGEGFEAQYAAMTDAYAANTTCAYPADADALAALERFGDAADQVLSLEALADPWGAVLSAGTLAGIDYTQAPTAHYPDSYIAWMQSLTAADVACG